MTTGFVYDSAFLDHDTGHGHPESPARTSAIMQVLNDSPWFDDLRQYAAVPATTDWLATTHSAEYIRRAANACDSGQPYLDSMDVAISPRSFDVATLAAGAPLALADALMSGDIHNGFALVRPPGHHAEAASALGFCLFNNIAILARYLQRRYALERIAIVDWDVHHGNGTQHAFESDATVMYASIHQYPYYPGTGAAHERGEGAGKGTTINCPVAAGANDDDYYAAFTTRILPALDAFAPDAVLISAGFDAHRDDPLAGVDLSSAAFRWMTTRLLEVADKHAGGRVISLLEGGYHLQRLAECVALHVDELRLGSAA